MPSGDANENNREKNLIYQKKNNDNKTRLCFWFFFSFKSPGGHAIYRQNARVLEMWNFTPAYI